VLVFIGLRILEPYSLLVLLVLPQAYKNMREISAAQINNPQQIAMMDVSSAQLHMKFGLLLSAGIILSAIF